MATSARRSRIAGPPPTGDGKGVAPGGGAAIPWRRDDVCMRQWPSTRRRTIDPAADDETLAEDRRPSNDVSTHAPIMEFHFHQARSTTRPARCASASARPMRVASVASARPSGAGRPSRAQATNACASRRNASSKRS
jgi:hypothetical protein